jgi:prepilin-type N-terminal cleavage/methylation domain-containing protein
MIKKERLELRRAGSRGFTLIEILIVVAIIAILASVVLVGLGPTQQAGRDSRRLSDLSETQNGLELYYNKCGYYPGTAAPTSCGTYSANNSWSGMSTALTGSAIGISNVPNDPSAGKTYQYGTDAAGDTYVIQATLENGNNSVFNNYTAPSITNITGITSCTQPSYCKTL